METHRWAPKDVTDGVAVCSISDWEHFYSFIHHEMLDYEHYFYRGQRCDNWLLEPTYDRLAKALAGRGRTLDPEAHLEAFKFAVRGRRGPHPPPLKSDNDWWALGQHHGLATPLLDWTESPFTAAFFAYAEVGADQTQMRAVYALGNPVRQDEPYPHGKLEFVFPLTDENPRLVGQGGLFTRVADGIDLERWVRATFKDVTDNAVLLKLLLPDSDREVALRSLQKMNINYLSLFPDIHGACSHCNTDAQLWPPQSAT